MTTIEFNKKLKCGNDYVAVEILDNGEEQQYGDILLPSSVTANGRLALCKVTDIGQNAAQKTGVKAGDYVMIDRLATFAHTSPIAALKYDSVICKSNENKSDFFPLKDSMFVEPDQKDDMTDVGGILVANYTERLNTGIVLKTAFEKTDEYPFEPGTRVMLVKGGDNVNFGDRNIHIFKKDMIVCAIED